VRSHVYLHLTLLLIEAKLLSAISHILPISTIIVTVTRNNISINNIVLIVYIFALHYCIIINYLSTVLRNTISTSSMSRDRSTAFVHELNMYWTKSNTYFRFDSAYSGTASAAPYVASYTPQRDQSADDATASLPIIELIKNAFTSVVDSTLKATSHASDIVKHYQDLLSSFMLVATPLYNIIRLIMLDCSWIDIAVNVGAIVASLHKIYRSVVTTDALLKAARYLFWSTHKRLFNSDVAYSGLDCKSIVTRTIGILVAMSAFCVKGTNALRDVSIAIGTITSIATLSDTIWNVVAAAFNTDGVATLVTQDMIHQKITMIDEYIALPTHNWSGAKLTEIRNFSLELTKFVTSKAVAESKLNLNVLNTKFQEFEKIRIGVARQISDSAPIPVPVAVHLYSRLGGVGKSSFVTYVAKMLSLALDNYNEHVYQYTTGSHFPRYLNQDTAFFDEPKASKSEHNVLNTINAIVSEGCPPCPGAEIDTKSQVLRIKTLFTAANRSLDGMGLNSCLGTKEAADAMISRFIQIEVCDPELEKKATGNILANRFGHSHRKQDFSHLTFKVRDPSKGTCVEKNAEQVISMIIDRMKQSVADFKNKHHATITLPASIAKKRFDTNVTLLPASAAQPTDSGKSSDDVPQQDLACASADRVFTVFASGQPGMGKSTSFADCVKQTAMLFGAQYHAPHTHAEAMSIVEQQTPAPRVLVLDDVYGELDKKEQQAQLQTLINTCDSNVYLYIISNFAPATRTMWWYRYSAPHKIQSFDVHGLHRRLNWSLEADKTDYIFHLDFLKFGTPTAMHDTNAIVDYNYLFKKMYEFKYATKSPKLASSVPEVLPFTIDEADLWLDFPTVPDIPEMFRALWKGIKTTRIPLAQQLQQDFDFSTLDTFAAKLLLHKLYAADPNMKVYVRIADKEYYLADGFYAFSEVAHPITFDPETMVATLRDVNYTITSHIVVAAMASIPPSGIDNLELIVALRNERLRNSTIWRTILGNVEIPTDSVLQAIKSKVTATSEVIKAIIREHPYLTAGLSMLAIIAPILYNHFKRPSKGVSEVLKQIDIAMPDCHYCNRNGVWIESPYCEASDAFKPGDQPYKGGRSGKLAKRPGKHYKAHRSTVTIRGAALEYDEDEDHGTNHLRHAVRESLIDGGEIYLDHYEGLKRVKNRAGGYTTMMVTSSYDSQGNHYIDVNPVVDVDEHYSPACMDYHKNVLGVLNLDSITESGSHMYLYGLAMNDCVVRIPRHMWRNPTDRVVLSNDRDIQFVVVKELDTNDAVYAMPTRNGKPMRLPGVRDITSKLASNMELAKATRCLLLDTDGVRTANLAYNYYEVLGDIHSVVNAEQRLTHRSAVISYADVGPIEFIRPGKCGSLALVSLAADAPLKIGGQLCTHRRGRKSYLYSAPTREEWMDFIAHTPPPTDVAYSSATPEPLDPVLATCMFSPSASELGIRPHIPRYFAYKCRPKMEADLQYFDGGFTTVASISNPYPMDPKGRRYPVYNSAFAEEFGMPVMPIAAAKDIVLEHADMIPPDDAGNLHAANVKLSKTRANKHVGHPSHKYKDLITECATRLGKYYRDRLGITNMNPLSNEEAMYGCTPPNGGVVEPMDRTTSVGSYRFMQKTVNTKGDLIPPQGDTPTAIQDEFLNFCKKQRATWMTDDPLFSPYQVQFKDALTGPAKAHKKRLIECGPPSDGVITKSIFAPCQAAFTKLGTKSPFLLAINPHTDFHAIWSRFKRCTRRYAFDVESFDLSISANSFLGFAHFHHAFYNAGPKMRKLIDNAAFSIYGTPLIVSDTVLRRDASMASGANPTSYTDSVMQLIKVYVACRVISGCDISVHDFVEGIECGICGDDIVLGVHETFENRKWAKCINGLTISTAMLNVFGMKYTGTQKDDGTEFPSLKMEEMEFCSRKCTEIPGHPGVYGGQLKLDSIIGELLWSKSDDAAVWRQTVTRAAPVDLAMHSDEVNAKFRRVLVKLNLDHEVEPVEAIRDTLRYETIQQSAQRNNVINLPLSITKLQTNSTVPKIPIPKIDFIQKYFPNSNTTSTKQDEDMSTRQLCLHVKRILANAEGKGLPTWDDFFSGCSIDDGAVAILLTRISQNDDGFVYSAMADGYDARGVFKNTKEVVPILSHTNTILCALKYTQGIVLDKNDDTFTKYIDKMGVMSCITGFRLNKTQFKTNRYIAFARALKHARDTQSIEALHWCVVQGIEDDNDDRPYAGGEQSTVERHETAAPPDATTESISGLAMGTSAIPVGVAANEISTTAAQNPVGVGVSSGNAIPNVILDGAHGVDMSMTHQTGTSVNVLTLAATSIFKEIVRLPVGISEGQVLYEASVNPWNSSILNPATMLWASMHRRFFGQLAIDVEVVSAATIIGSIKCGVIPAVYTRKGATPTQATLDSFTATQINLAASGKSCVKFTPTTAEHALTGVYSDSPEQDYGWFYVIAATDIQNAYDAAATIQLKLSMRMCEGSVYDLPTFLGASALPLAPAFLDIQGPATILATDGIHVDGIDYTELHTDDFLVFGEPKNGTFMTHSFNDEVAYHDDNRPLKAIVAAGRGLLEATDVPGHKSRFDISALMPKYLPKTGFVLKNGTFTQKPKWYKDEQYETDDKIVWTNARWKHPYKRELHDLEISQMNCIMDLGNQTWGAVDGLHSRIAGDEGWLLYNIMNGDDGDNFVTHVGTKLYDTHEGVRANHLRIAGFYKVWPVPTNVPAHSATGDVCLPTDHYSGTVITTGVPICNKAAISTPICDFSYRPLKFVSTDDILPAVVPGLVGQTIPVGALHARSVYDAVSYAKSQGAAAVITNLVSRSGQQLCSILRNSQGAFISATGTTEYSRSSFIISSDMRQTHVLVSEDFPSLPSVSVPAFTDRTVKSSTVTARVGPFTRSGVLEFDKLKAIVPEDDVAYSSAAAVAGITQGGNFFTNFLNDVFGIGRTAMENATKRDIAKLGAETQLKVAQQQIQLKRQFMNQAALRTSWRAPST